MTKTPDALQLTRELLKFNTINPPGAEQACAQHLGDLLKRAGFTVDYAEFAPTRTSLVAKIGGVKGKRPLGFTGHIDTVPLGSAAWKADAFGASLEGGKLYGRGSSDMKSGVAAFVVAALRMVEQLKNGPGVTLVITADEECGCGGATYMVKQGNLLGEVGALVIGEPTANYPLVGHKGAFWLDVKTHGITAHGSMPEQGDNAIYKAAAAITKLRDFDFETPAHALMGAPTLNVGTVHGGLNINSVPDSTVIGVDIRSVPGQDHALLQSRMQRMLGETVEVTPTLDVASIYSDPAQPWIQHVFDVTQSRLGARPQAKTATYFTDAAVLKEAYRDIPMVVLGPGEPQLAHQTDEYCLVDRIEESVAIYSELIKDWSH
ncbi:MAG: M20 family metallopeptidase [Betaproteobacteria bacterium]|nr:M20 family metallopeptidase [Betaproteobacteria bacterium]